MNKTSNSRDWRYLPRNLLFDIADKLTSIDDFVRFGAACLSWRSIFLENKNQVCSHSPPFLLTALPYQQEDVKYLYQQQQKRAVYSPGNRKLYNLHLQLPRYHICCGSSFGWLINLEERGRDKYYIQLQNPFLKKSIHLPRLDDIFQLYLDLFASIVTRPGSLAAIVQQPDHPLLPLLECSVKQCIDEVFQRRGLPFHKSENPPQPFDFLRKAALSSEPSSASEFIVVGIVSKFYSMAYFKSGDTTCTPIGEMNWLKEVRSFTDVIYSNKTKQFYVSLSSGEVLAIDFVGEELEPKFTPVAPPNRGLRDMVLVEDLSSGDLYQVNNDIVTSMDWHPISKFNVFKFDSAEKKWERVHDLGNNVMFFGYNCSMLRSASNCPGCEPNCIYFITYPHCCMDMQYYELPYAGIYNLEDGSIRPLSADDAFNHLAPAYFMLRIVSLFFF